MRYALICTLALAACQSQAPQNAASMANPASVYCLNQGGKLEMVQTAEGTQGMCHLPDGRVVEEWAHLRAAQEI